MRRALLFGAGSAVCAAALLARPAVGAVGSGEVSPEAGAPLPGATGTYSAHGEAKHGYLDVCRASNADRCLAGLESAGAVVCQSLLSTAEFRALRDAVAQGANAVQPKERFVRRYHYDLLINEALAARVERLFAKGTEAGALVRRFLGRDDVSLTEIQLVYTKPGAGTQIFHVDNAAKGITIAIAIDPICSARGTTQLVGGSHALFCADMHVAARMRSALRARLISPELSRGAAVVFDSRLLHRGMGNTSSETRPLLILRFDAPETPPPQVGRLGTLALAALGRAAAAVLPHRTLPMDASAGSASRRGGATGADAEDAR